MYVCSAKGLGENEIKKGWCGVRRYYFNINAQGTVIVDAGEHEDEWVDLIGFLCARPKDRGSTGLDGPFDMLLGAGLALLVSIIRILAIYGEEWFGGNFGSWGRLNSVYV